VLKASPDGSKNENCSVSTSPCDIYTAMSLIVSEDTLMFQPGTYFLGQSLVFDQKQNISIIGTDAILNCSSSMYGYAILATYSSLYLEGITITQCTPLSTWNSAVNLTSSPTIINNWVFQDNKISNLQSNYYDVHNIYPFMHRCEPRIIANSKFQIHQQHCYIQAIL